ncbi:MAG: M1 family aminopeptidase [Bacteroidales bacterium]
MKNIFQYIIGTFLAIITIQSCNNSESLILSQNGVSYQLATLRKSAISNIEYNLSFELPKEQTEKILGKLSLKIELDKDKYPHNLIIDFKENANNIIDIKANGKETKYKFENEHIIIPAKHIITGQNTIDIQFIAGEQSLNRNKDFMYTLLVPDRARTLFPCFDQPNMKATYKLKLKIPKNWEAIGNSTCTNATTCKDTTYKIMEFAPTEPLSTYLFSFVAGEFTKSTNTKGDRTINIYHRENDEKKTAQLAEIARQVFASLEWLEDYTAVPYPFSKYDLIILPGFQYGGMEHTGATLYKNSTLFLPPNPTLSQELSRTQLIAHETAHMWFGDFVTMDWFSGVWIKEVFANFFASKMIRPLYPNVDFAINDLGFYSAAYAEERTNGTTSIQQELPNLKYAGLIYGNIVYQKSPVVMSMLYDKMGDENFKTAIREYLTTYAYGNASWDNLVDIFVKHQPQEYKGSANDIKEWSKYWVYGKGMPHITINNKNIIGLAESMQTIQIDTIKEYLIPNLNGKFYGYIELDEKTIDFILENLYNSTILPQKGVVKKSLLITLHENWLNNNLSGEKFIKHLCNYLKIEQDPQIYPSILGYILEISEKSLSNINAHGSELQRYTEEQLWAYVTNTKNKKYATQAFRSLVGIAENPTILDYIYNIWESENFSNASKTKIAKHYIPNLKLSDGDYKKMSYQLAIKMPLLASNNTTALKNSKYNGVNIRDYITATQKARLKNADEIREFEYISRGTLADTTELDNIFNSLLMAENRAIEPWTQSLLGLLNHSLRQKHAVKYIKPALAAMEDIQATGDIFFPKGWIGSTLSGHHSKEAGVIVNKYLAENPNMLQLLKNKVLQSAYNLPQ